MRIILSPAKKMADRWEEFSADTTPVFLEDAKLLLKYMKSLDQEQLQALWNCSDRIAQENFTRLEHMDLEKHVTPALLAYDGIAFKYMAPMVFTQSCFDYVQETLVILSAFYGVLRPSDGVTPYRLEMQAKANPWGKNSLYDFWNDKLYKEVQASNSDRVIINLASKEYSKCIEDFLTPQDRYVSVVFGEMYKGRFVTKGTYAKMARGEMVRFMAENNVRSPEQIKSFDRLGYCFRTDLSTPDQFVFCRK